MTEPLVIVEQYQFLPEATAVRMHLQSEGIAAQLLDAETVSTDWALGNAVGYIKLQVPSSQAEQTLAILQQLREKRKAREAESGTEPNRCLSCDAVLLPEQSTCPACGWSYQTDEPIDEEKDPIVDLDDPDAPRPESLMDSMRSLKRLMVMLVLVPFAATMILLAWTIFTFAFHSIVGY